MPQFIQNSYSPDNSLAKAISSLGDAFAPSPATQLAAANVRKMQLQTEIGGQMKGLAEAAARGDRNAAAQLTGLGVQYDPSAGNAMPYLRYGGVQHQDPNSPGYNRNASQTAFATGAAYGTTPQGQADEAAAALQRQEAANRASIEAARQKAQIETANAIELQKQKLAAEQAAADREPVVVQGPNGPTYTTKGALRQQASGMTGGSPAGDAAPQFSPPPDASTINQREKSAAEAAARANEVVAVRDAATGQVGYAPRAEVEKQPGRYVPLEDPTVLAARERGKAEAEQKSREMMQVIDATTGQPGYVSRLDVETNPGRYQPILTMEQQGGVIAGREYGGGARPQGPQPPQGGVMEPAVPERDFGAGRPVPEAAQPQQAPQRMGSNVPAFVREKFEGTSSDIAKLQKEADALPPNDPRRAQIESAIRSKTAGPGEVAIAGKNAERLGTAVDGYAKAMENGEKMISRLQAMQSLLSQGVQTGPLRQIIQPVLAAAAEVGLIDPKSPAIGAALQGQSNAAVIDALGGSLGAQISNTDRDFMTAIKPGLDKLPQTNQITIEILTRLARNNIEAAKEAARFSSSPGATPEGLILHMGKWREGQRLFEDMKSLVPQAQAGAAGRSVGQPAPAPQGGGWKVERAQ